MYLKFHYFRKIALLGSIILSFFMFGGKTRAAYNWHLRYDTWESGQAVDEVQELDSHYHDCYRGDSVSVIFQATQSCTITHIGILFQGTNLYYEYVLRYCKNPTIDGNGFPIIPSGGACNPGPNPSIITDQGMGFYVLNLQSYGSSYTVSMNAGDILVFSLMNYGEYPSLDNANVNLCTDSSVGVEYHQTYITDVNPSNCGPGTDTNQWIEDFGISHDFIIRAGWVVPDPTNTPLVPTATPTSTSTAIPTSTVTPTPTSTNSPVPTSTFTQTPTQTPTFTSTPLPTSTPTPTFTSTPLPTSTPTSTNTNTPLPTATATPTTPPGTATYTQLPSTATPTSSPTETNTPIPTFTPPPTYTPLPTYTPYPTFTPSATPIPSTATPTYTSTPTSTQTPTPGITETSTPTQTSTPTSSHTPTQTPTIVFSVTPTPSSTPSSTPTISPTPSSSPSPTPTYEPYRLPFFDLFEEELPWEIHPDIGTCFWHSETVRYVSFSHSWAYNSGDPNYNYLSGGRNACSFVSPRITLVGAISPVFTYWDWIETENRAGFDVCNTEITTNGGQTWLPITTTNTPTMQWIQRGPYDLSAYREHVIQIRFRFDTVDAQFNDFEGWYIDDVRIDEGDVPSPTPTPYSGYTGVDLLLNKDVFYETDLFLLEIDYLNPNAAPIQTDLYIVLDVYGSYWFWPAWSQEIDNDSRIMPSRSITRETLLEFVWPYYGGSFDGVAIWAAVLVPGTSNLIGTYDHVTFGCNL